LLTLYFCAKDLISQDILSTQDGITLSQTEIMSRHHKEKTGDGEEVVEEGDEVVFLYRIVPGNGPSASYGIWCAGIAGLPSTTIERGNTMSSFYKKFFCVVLKPLVICTAIELSELYIQEKPINKITSLQDEKNYKMLEIIKNEFLETYIDQLNPLDLITSIESLFKKEDA
jgi:DNA mismatch repair protein MSH5